MTTDGFSVKTTISQMANVARAQVKGQAQAAPSATEKMLKQDKRTDRVKRSQEVQKNKVDPDSERPRGRQDEGREAPPEDLQEAVAEREAAGEARDDEDGNKGVVLDTKA